MIALIMAFFTGISFRSSKLARGRSRPWLWTIHWLNMRGSPAKG